MNIYQFKQINGFGHLVQKQSNTRHLSWIKQVGGRLQTEIIGQLGASVPALLSQAITQFQTAAANEDECYLIISKSELTPQIAALDSERDTKYVGLKSMADGLHRIGSAEQQQAAGQLIDLCAHYKVDISERYDDETTKMSQLLQELQTPAWTARIETLGLTATVGELVSLNQQIKHLIDLRNNDLAQVTPQAMLQARTASDDAYALVVTIINAFAVADWADGSSHYDQAIARINQDQDYYLKNVFTQGKGGASSGNQNTQNNQNNQSNQNNQNNQSNQNTPSNPSNPENPGDSGSGGDIPGTNPDPNPGGGGDDGDGME